MEGKTKANTAAIADLQALLDSIPTNSRDPDDIFARLYILELIERHSQRAKECTSCKSNRNR